MKKLSRLQKVLLSLPLLLLAFYQVTFLYPTRFTWLIPSMKVYYIEIGILACLHLVLLFILLKRIWKYEHVNRKLKSDWTWYLLLFGWITIFIYIWKKDNEFQQLNQISQE